MNTNKQTIFDNHTSPAALLACAGGIHPKQLTTSFFHFVCQHLGVHPQTCIMRGQREMSVEVQTTLVGADHPVLVFLCFTVCLGRTCAVMSDAPIIEQLYRNVNGASYE
jgi:hypothetical protein